MAAALCGCGAGFFDFEKLNSGPESTEGEASKPNAPVSEMPVPKAPEAPSNLRVNYSIEEANISWDIVDNVDGYNVYRSESAGGQYEMAYTWWANNTCQIQGLPPKTPSYYKVSAFRLNPNTGEYIEGKLSAYIIVSMPDLRYPPDWVSAWMMKDLVDSAYVEWYTNYDDVQYRVYRDSEPVGTTSEMFYKDTGLSAGHVYEYTVAVVTADGEGPQSSPSPDSSVTTRPAVPVIETEKPSLLSSYGGDLYSIEFYIGWELLPYADSYNVYRSAGANGPYTLIKNDIKNTQPWVTKLWYADTVTSALNTYYYYKVSAVNESGESELSKYAATILWAAPAGVKAEYNNFYIEIGWDEYSYAKASEYKVYRNTNNRDDYTYVGTSLTNAYNDTELTGSVAYYYKVTAVIDGVESRPAYASVYTVKPGDPGTPSNPVRQPTLADNVKVTLGTITWNDVYSASYYKVYRDGKYLTKTILPWYTDILGMLGNHDYYVIVVYGN